MAKRRVAVAGFWYNCRMQINRKEFIAGIGATGVALACGISSARTPKGGSMLKGISPVVSPDLLKILAEMGHGDEIVFADAHFPAHTFGRDGAIVLRADAVACDTLLAGVTPLFELDAYAVPVVMMRQSQAIRSTQPSKRRTVQRSGTTEKSNLWSGSPFTNARKKLTPSSSPASCANTGISSSKKG
jgi:L-fucose mutarotase